MQHLIQPFKLSFKTPVSKPELYRLSSSIKRRPAQKSTVVQNQKSKKLDNYFISFVRFLRYLYLPLFLLIEIKLCQNIRHLLIIMSSLTPKNWVGTQRPTITVKNVRSGLKNYLVLALLIFLRLEGVDASVVKGDLKVGQLVNFDGEKACVATITSAGGTMDYFDAIDCPNCPQSEAFTNSDVSRIQAICTSAKCGSGNFPKAKPSPESCQEKYGEKVVEKTR